MSRAGTGVTTLPVAAWIPTCSFPSAPQVLPCFRSMKPSRYAERARCADRVCGGHWTAALLVSGAAPLRTSDASTGAGAHHDEIPDCFHRRIHDRVTPLTIPRTRVPAYGCGNSRSNDSSSAANSGCFLKQPAHVFTVLLRPVSEAHEPVSACPESPITSTVAASSNSVGSASKGDKWPLATMTADRIRGIVEYVIENSSQGQKKAVFAR